MLEVSTVDCSLLVIQQVNSGDDLLVPSYCMKTDWTLLRLAYSMVMILVP